MFQLIPPPPQLAAYVRSFWVFESDALFEQPYQYRSMADAMPELIFQYKGRFSNQDRSVPTSSIFAQSHLVRQMESSGHFGLVGVYLYPSALSKIIPMPANELTALMVDLHAVFGQEGRELEEKIVLAAGSKERIRIISEFLLSKIYRCATTEHGIEASVKSVMHKGGTIDVTRLAYDANLSLRQYERKFKAHTGFSPKLFSRIVRFQAALNRPGSARSLTDVAYSLGYYDQSHFIHEFKEFSGVHPSLYFSGKAEGTELRASI